MQEYQLICRNYKGNVFSCAEITKGMSFHVLKMPKQVQKMSFHVLKIPKQVHFVKTSHFTKTNQNNLFIFLESQTSNYDYNFISQGGY